jgi:hypothetical protein
MTKFIAALIIVAVLYGGWELFLYWEKVRDEDERVKKQEVSAAVVPEQLQGMPGQNPTQLEATLRAAQSQGAEALKNWLKTYGRAVQDPRKAWIELDYCTMISREDPNEAKRIFAEVKNRTPPSSPVWPRIQKLEKTYE